MQILVVLQKLLQPDYSLVLKSELTWNGSPLPKSIASSLVVIEGNMKLCVTC